jgi:hypothetical protein
MMNENKKANGAPHYYPRKMRTGWCVAHEVTAAGVTIERYGIHCQTYAEAYRRAEVMNREQQPSAMNETDAASKRMTASDGHVGSGTDGNSVTAKGDK